MLPFPFSMILNNRKYGVGLGYILSAVALLLLACGMVVLKPDFTIATSNPNDPGQDSNLAATNDPGFPISETFQPNPREIFASEVNLRIPRRKLFQLRLKREEAIRNQLLVSSESDWVRAWLDSEGAEIPVKLRLKGDWTDHLKDEKWSFRVKCTGGTAWKGLRVFSLQSPHTRNFLHEWALHRFLREQGLLTPRYDFVRLKINGADLGVYALEEHFSKELLENQGRREGPIMKFDENGLWAVRDRQFKENIDLTEGAPVFQGADILPFQPLKHVNDPILRNQLLAANNLMFQYKSGALHPDSFAIPLDHIFDLKLMGKRQAVLDLFGAHHALYWSNTRFYYNPFTSKLEPVVFDGYGEPDPEPVIKGPFLGYEMNARTTFGDPSERLGTLLFAEPEFLDAYYGMLHDWDAGKVEGWIEENKEACKRREQWIRSEYLFYHHSWNREKWNAKEVRDTLTKEGFREAGGVPLAGQSYPFSRQPQPLPHENDLDGPPRLHPSHDLPRSGFALG